MKDSFIRWKDCLPFMTIFKVRPSYRSEPHNIVHFAGEEADVKDSYAEPEQPQQDKPKDQDEELIEINLAIQKEEPNPFLSVLTCRRAEADTCHSFHVHVPIC